MLRKAADLLADYGWLARQTGPTGAEGRRAQRSAT